MKEFFKQLLEKLTSRKFLMCLAVVGIGVMLASGVTSSELQEIIAMLTTLFSGLTYVVSEATIDKASLKAREAEAKAEIAKAEVAKAEVELKASLATKG